jgi:transcriptional regulator with XRE-family HTH domain
MPNKTQNINTLDIYRRRMRLSTRHVAILLGDKDVSRLSKYERGQRLPNLRNAFRLSAILRVPVEFLFPSLYDLLREQIRAEEERIAKPTQATLF